MAKPFVTVVIPTYRRPAMLARAIRSVLSQTFSDFRVCVYDNASGDETEAVVEKFRREDSRVEYTRRPHNVGGFANFVDGASRVETPFFLFLPDDDILLPTLFESALAGFRRHPEAAMSILATLHMSPGGLLRYAYVARWQQGLLPAPTGMLCALRYGNPGLPSMLIRTEVWHEFGGFDETTEPASDLDFELRVGARLPVAVSRQPGAIQIMHSGAHTAKGGLGWSWPCLPRIIEKFANDPILGAGVRKETAETLTRCMIRSLVFRGGILSILRNHMEDAERAADILESCRRPRAAKAIRLALRSSRKLAPARITLRAILQLKEYAETVRNLDLQWRFRRFSTLVRSCSNTAENLVFDGLDTDRHALDSEFVFKQ